MDRFAEAGLRWLLCVALLVPVPSCKSEKDQEFDTNARDNLSACVEAVEAIGQAPESRRLLLILKGCPHACPALPALAIADPSKRASLLLEQCGLACSEEAKRAFEAAPEGEKWSALVDKCGHDYYGLPKGGAHLLTTDWYVLHRVAKWIADTAGRAGPDGTKLLAKLDRIAESAPFRLPLAPSSAGFRLLSSERGQPAMAPLYAVATGKGVTIAEMPKATLTSRGVVLTEVAGGAFPGQRVATGDLRARLDDLLERSGQQALRRGKGSSSTRGGEGKMGKGPPKDNVFGIKGPKGNPDPRLAQREHSEEGKMGTPDRARPSSSGEGVLWALWGPRAAVLVLASGDLPATDLAAWVSALGPHAARLGMASTGTLKAHRLALCAPHRSGGAACGESFQSAGDAAPERLHLVIADDGIHIVEVSAEGEVRRSALVGPAEDDQALRRVLDDQVQFGGFDAELWLTVEGRLRLETLVRVLDAASSRRGINLAVLDQRVTSWRKRHLGRYEPRAWKPKRGAGTINLGGFGSSGSRRRPDGRGYGLGDLGRAGEGPRRSRRRPDGRGYGRMGEGYGDK